MLKIKHVAVCMLALAMLSAAQRSNGAVRHGGFRAARYA